MFWRIITLSYTRNWIVLRFQSKIRVGKNSLDTSLLQSLEISPDPSIRFQLRTPSYTMERAWKATLEDHPGLNNPEFDRQHYDVPASFPGNRLALVVKVQNGEHLQLSGVLCIWERKHCSRSEWMEATMVITLTTHTHRLQSPFQRFAQRDLLNICLRNG